MGIDINNKQLTPQQKEQLLELIGNYRSVFSINTSELGCARGFTHKINTENAKPKAQHPYRKSPKIAEIEDREIDDMMKNKIIQESTSPWQSPVVLCKKTSGDYRFAVDYRALNKLTEPESYPVPLLENIFDTISTADAKFFTTLDLASGFWQIPMDPLDRHKTSFATRKRKFEFLRMPFGLRNTPTTYQRLMCKVFQGLNWKTLLVYMDDIINFSSTFEEHLDHLKQVFERLQDANPQGQTLQAIPCGLNSLASCNRIQGHLMN